MPSTDENGLPFVTRKMLSFEQGNRFDLEVSVVGYNTGTVKLTGMTREAPFSFSFSPAGDQTLETFIFGIGDVPIAVAIHTGATRVDEGDFYVSVYLRANQTRIQKLCAGYVTTLKGMSWPQTTTESPTPGFRLPRVLGSGANPAAGTEVAETVPAGQIWKVQSIGLGLVTDATVANRHVQVIIKDSSGNFMYIFWGSTDQTASVDWSYFFAPYPHIAAEKNGTNLVISMPKDIIMYEGWVIATSTTLLKAGDNYYPPTIMGELYMRPPN